MKISIVILTYNTKEITDICIQKALRASKFCTNKTKTIIDIIVVDNASTDGTVAYLRKRYPTITVLRNKTNKGVSVGYNVGMKKAQSSDFILLLNSDLYLEEDTIYNSFLYMLKNKKCDVLMCKLFDSTNSFEAYGGHLPTPTKTALWLFGAESIPLIRSIVKKIYGYNLDKYSTDFEMEWAPSCFYFLKSEVFRKTGGHDEKIFIYMDDVEWCKRIHDAGYKLFFTPSFTSVHLCGASTVNKGIDGWRLSQQVAGIKYYQEKHHPRTAKLISMLLSIGLTLRSILYLFSGNTTTARYYIQSRSASL